MWSGKYPDRALRRIARSASGRLVSIMLLVGLLAYAGTAWAAGPQWPLAQDTAAVISSPQSLSSVRGTVSITGSALHPQFQRYELYYTPEPGENWVFIGDAVTNPVQTGCSAPGRQPACLTATTACGCASSGRMATTMRASHATSWWPT